MTLLALACPNCATALADAPERSLFVCATCARTLSPRVDGRGLIEVTRTSVRPQRRPEAGAQLVLLPTWSVTLHRDLLGGIGVSLPARVLVPAVGVGRLQTLLQFGRNLTRAPIDPQPWDGVDVRGDAAEVAAEDALVLAETVVLRHLDHWPSDDQLPTLDIPLGRAELLDWPCQIRGGELIDLVGGISVQRTMIESVDLTDRTAALEGAFEALGVGPA